MKTYDVRPDRNADEYSEFFLDVYGCLFETKEEANFTGIAAVVLTSTFFCGSIDDWKKVIRSNLRHEYGLNV